MVEKLGLLGVGDEVGDVEEGGDVPDGVVREAPQSQRRRGPLRRRRRRFLGRRVLHGCFNRDFEREGCVAWAASGLSLLEAHVFNSIRYGRYQPMYIIRRNIWGLLSMHITVFNWSILLIPLFNTKNLFLYLIGGAPTYYQYYYHYLNCLSIEDFFLHPQDGNGYPKPEYLTGFTR